MDPCPTAPRKATTAVAFRNIYISEPASDPSVSPLSAHLRPKFYEFIHSRWMILLSLNISVNFSDALHRILPMAYNL
jgi:hypothetical protein